MIFLSTGLSVGCLEGAGSLSAKEDGFYGGQRNMKVRK